ncbi:hypothetical protein NTGM5_460005 [Candidatus Nitrotoga sp. M5]|nr:hypothetical protein NTGM5_460005 [Candidatus Nitrotoga sp. M5]
MGALSEKLPFNKAYVMTIVGTERNWAGLAHNDGKVTELAPIE